MVYWLVLKALPLRPIAAIALVGIGLEMIGVPVIGPAVDLGSSLLDQLLAWIESQFVDSVTFW